MNLFRRFCDRPWGGAYQTLGKTPGEAAGFAPLTGFRWHELLKRAVPKAPSEYVEIELVPN